MTNIGPSTLVDIIVDDDQLGEVGVIPELPPGQSVPFEIETGEPEDIAPMVIHLLSDAGRDVNAQIYTVVGGRISVWNQPMEVRTMMAEDGGWTPESIAARFEEVGQEPNPFIADLERRMAEMAEHKGEG